MSCVSAAGERTAVFYVGGNVNLKIKVCRNVTAHPAFIFWFEVFFFGC